MKYGKEAGTMAEYVNAMGGLIGNQYPFRYVKPI
jgi:hypothetical protein